MKFLVLALAFFGLCRPAFPTPMSMDLVLSSTYRDSLYDPTGALDPILEAPAYVNLLLNVPDPVIEPHADYTDLIYSVNDASLVLDFGVLQLSSSTGQIIYRDIPGNFFDQVYFYFLLDHALGFDDLRFNYFNELQPDGTGLTTMVPNFIDPFGDNFGQWGLTSESGGLSTSLSGGEFVNVTVPEPYSLALLLGGFGLLLARAAQPLGTHAPTRARRRAVGEPAVRRAVSRDGLNEVVGRVGIEPTTNGLRVHCSA